MKRALNVFTWTTTQNGQTVRCVVATHSRSDAARLAGLERIEAALEPSQCQPWRRCKTGRFSRFVPAKLETKGCTENNPLSRAFCDV